MYRLSWNLEDSTSWKPQGLSRPVMGLLYLLPLLFEKSSRNFLDPKILKAILPTCVSARLPTKHLSHRKGFNLKLNRRIHLLSITNSCIQLKHFHNFHLKLYTLKMFVMRTTTNLKNPTCFDRFADHHQGLVPVPCTITTCQFFCFFAFQVAWWSAKRSKHVGL